MVYCGDCLYSRLKRDKQGQVTGEQYCIKLNHLRGTYQRVTCLGFIDKADKRIQVNWLRR